MNLEANIIEILEKSISKSKQIVTEALDNGNIVVMDGLSATWSGH
jgi:hypothetical protein